LAKAAVVDGNAEATTFAHSGKQRLRSDDERKKSSGRATQWARDSWGKDDASATEPQRLGDEAMQILHGDRALPSDIENRPVGSRLVDERDHCFDNISDVSWMNDDVSADFERPSSSEDSPQQSLGNCRGP
jgi:hypothetical protein